MATPPPLPHPKDDPAVHAARTTRAAYLDAVARIRVQGNVTELDRARAINKAWRSTVAEMRGHYRDLTGRRQARLSWLEQQLPIRPDIPADASAADRQVLLAAWRTALDAARAADAEQRLTMLEDAERYGDATTVRAVLAAAVDDSQWPTVERWAAAANPEAGQHFTEWRELRTLMTGASIDNLWVSQAFAAVPKPDESAQLPRLVDAYNDKVMRHNATRARTTPPRALIELAPEETDAGATEAPAA
ncbi:hypothetical protein [Streptomyces sp. YIM 98790]|uniref:hypothetical protein n=1 Tax=Streptomyces sp. YIM 98790 TaxID=2689077 RepID=UPI0014093E8E|nr:hypothetical protein [Streptomyces sp. YIM 98790]